MPAGNCSVLVVLDSRRVAERACADRTVFAALDHFGPAYEALECADHYGLPLGHVSPRAAYILAHDGAGAELPARAATEIAEAVRAGTGLISFDREVEKWPDCLRALVPAPAGVTTVEQLSLGARWLHHPGTRGAIRSRSWLRSGGHLPRRPRASSHSCRRRKAPA